MRTALPWRLAAILAVSLLGCSSYGWVRYAEDPAERPSVAIVTLANDSAEPGVEMLVSDAIRREVLRRGGARLVRNPDAADWVLRGRVAEVTSTAASLSTVVLEIERSVAVRIELEAVNRNGKKVVPPRTALWDTERVLSSADAEVARTQELEALRRIAGTIAVRIHDTLDPVWIP